MYKSYSKVFQQLLSFDFLAKWLKIKFHLKKVYRPQIQIVHFLFTRPIPNYLAQPRRHQTTTPIHLLLKIHQHTTPTHKPQAILVTTAPTRQLNNLNPSNNPFSTPHISPIHTRTVNTAPPIHISTHSTRHRIRTHAQTF